MFGFCCGAMHSETVQALRGRTQSILEVFRIRIFAGDLSRYLSRGSAFAFGRILVEFEAVFQSFSFSLCAEPWRPA